MSYQVMFRLRAKIAYDVEIAAFHFCYCQSIQSYSKSVHASLMALRSPAKRDGGTSRCKIHFIGSIIE